MLFVFQDKPKAESAETYSVSMEKPIVQSQDRGDGGCEETTLKPPVVDEATQQIVSTYNPLKALAVPVTQQTISTYTVPSPVSRTAMAGKVFPGFTFASFTSGLGS